MPLDVVRANVVNIYLCHLQWRIQFFFLLSLDNGAYLQSDVQSCVATIRRYMFLEKKGHQY